MEINEDVPNSVDYIIKEYKENIIDKKVQDNYRSNLLVSTFIMNFALICLQEFFNKDQIIKNSVSGGIKELWMFCVMLLYIGIYLFSFIKKSTEYTKLVDICILIMFFQNILMM